MGRGSAVKCDLLDLGRMHSFQELQLAIAYWATWLLIATLAAVVWLVWWLVPRLARWVPIGVTALVVAFISTLYQRVEIANGAMRLEMHPFTARVIRLAEIRSAEVRTYRGVAEYGGWGIRFGSPGTAYTSYGDRGVQLVLTSGEQVLIGSQRAEELLHAIEQAKRPEGQPSPPRP